MRQQPRQVAAIAEKMHLVADADLIAEHPQSVAVRPVAADEQMHVLADDLQQVGGPNRVLHPLVRQEPADQPDKPGVVGQAQLVEELPARGNGRGRNRHAAWNHAELLARQPAFCVILGDARAVGHQSRTVSADGPLQPASQHAARRAGRAEPGHQPVHAAADRRGQPVSVGGERPGLDHVGPQPIDQPLETPERQRIDRTAAAEERRLKAHRGERFGHHPAVRKQRRRARRNPLAQAPAATDTVVFPCRRGRASG